MHEVEKELKLTLKGKWEIAGSGEQLDNVLKETHVVSIMRYQLLATGANLVDNKNDRPLSHQIRRQPKTERENPNHLNKRIKALFEKRAESHVGGKIVPIRRIVTGILPYVKTTFQKQDADAAKIVIADMLSWRRSPTRSRRKEVRKDHLRC